jgi:hypothetical protein
MDQTDEAVKVIEDESEVIDGEELEVSTGEINDQTATFLGLEDLIKNHVESIDKMRLELKQAREMFDDSFNNNPTYREHLERVKEANKAKNSVKQQIIKQPSVSQLDQKVKDIRFDLSEKGKTLSDLLQDYKEQTGNSSIETRDGQILEIVSISKLVRRSSK